MNHATSGLWARRALQTAPPRYTKIIRKTLINLTILKNKMGKNHDLAYKLTSVFNNIFKYYIEYSVKGKELPEQALIASNHPSRLDHVALRNGLDKKVCFFGKPEKSFLDVGIINLNKLSIRESLYKAEKRLGEGYYLVIFPEGGGYNQEIGKMRPGVHFFSKHLKIPVVPISIKGTKDIWPINQKRPGIEGKIILNIGKPLNPEEMNKKDFCIELKENLMELYNNS